MTDHALAAALVTATTFEQALRADLDGPDRAPIRDVLRHTVAQKVALERMISARVVRQLSTS